MTERFILAFEDFDWWAIQDTFGEYSDKEDYIEWLSGQQAVDVMNELYNEKKNLKSILNDFLSILNRLQSDPNNEHLLGVARDMLQNMGVNLIDEGRPSVFNLIDDNIKELEDRYEFGQSKYYSACPMHNIQFGINTLKQLKEELKNE